MAEANHVQRAACRCGPPSEQCVPDDEQISQHGWRRSRFRNQPRLERELGLSTLRGAISVEEATRYVLQWEEPTEQQLKKARVRRTTAGTLRAAGFAVVHTPRRVRGNAHCTITWPASDPIDHPRVPWPPDVSDRFDACFNEIEEVKTDES